MADPAVLYVVTAVVVAALIVWVITVLLTAPKLVPAPPKLAPHPASGILAAQRRSTPPPAAGTPLRAPAAGSPPPGVFGRGMPPGPAPALATVIVEIPSRPPPAIAVNLPTMRQRLDSHPEIQDTLPGDGPLITVPEDEGGPPGPPLTLVSALGRSDPSPRERPDGAFAIVDRNHLFALADGSGHAAGASASQLAVDAVTAAFDLDDTSAFVDNPNLSPRANRLRRAILLANRKITHRANEASKKAIGGTTGTGLRTAVVAVYFAPNNRRIYVANVGASRCFRLRTAVIEELTSGAAMAGGVLGAKDSVDVQVVSLTAQAADVYLLCTAGLARALASEDIGTRIMTAASLEAATTSLVDAAKEKGEAADLTAILVRVEGPTVTPMPPF
jgi:serine/threonine protein phosphatase PrpC